jgi:hypothetical protein
MANPNIFAPSLASVTLAALRVVLVFAFVHRNRRIKRIHRLSVLYKLFNYRVHDIPRLVALTPRLHDFSEAATIVLAASATSCGGYCS